MYNQGNSNVRPIAPRTKEKDDLSRKWVSTYFYNIFESISDWGWAEDPYSWCDGFIVSAETWNYVELKTRHVNSTAYDGLTAIEIDKVHEIEELGKDNNGNNITHIIILFKDCVAWLPPQNYEKAKKGLKTLHDAPDENPTTKEWSAQDKVSRLFDIRHFVRLPYSYFGVTKPDWV